MKDWIGNKKTTFSTLGASNHAAHERHADDYYATDPAAVNALADREFIYHSVWENAAGGRHLSSRLSALGYHVRETDIVVRDPQVEQLDFLASSEKWDGDIVTNPPYKYAQEWVEKSLASIADGRKVCLFLKLTFLEGARRKKMFEQHPPIRIHVFSKRMKCAIDGDFESVGSSAVAYAWFVWEKGFTGSPSIHWI